MKTFKILILVLALLGISGVAMTQEPAPVKGEKSYSSRFAGEPTLVEDLSKIRSNMGYQISPEARFGISSSKGLRVGFQLRF